MVNRICVSINNRCNLACEYCHFRQKVAQEEVEMDIFRILDNVVEYAKDDFKIGFVGNGEPFLDWDILKSYIEYLEKCPYISIYTITNGTVSLSEEDWAFLERHCVNVGFSIDGFKEIHDKYRCGSFDKAMSNVEKYRRITGHYPTFNATVGKESLKYSRKIVDFFKTFNSRVTFSRMIGNQGISLEEYHRFLDEAEREINIRRGADDCTMYGGRCAAGINNYYFANGKVYLCGNCVDMQPIGDSDMRFEDIEAVDFNFDRTHCYREIFYENRALWDANGR